MILTVAWGKKKQDEINVSRSGLDKENENMHTQQTPFRPSTSFLYLKCVTCNKAIFFLILITYV